MACTSTTIRLSGSHFCNKDLDVILRKWKAGGFSNLEYLWIRSQNITNNGTIVLEMNWMDLVGNVIQTEDGSKTATINMALGGIEISVTPFE